MEFVGRAVQFWVLQSGCPRIYLVLVRTVLALGRLSDCDILLRWPFAERLGWSRLVPKSKWPRREFQDDRLCVLALADLDIQTLPGSIGQLTALQDLRCGWNDLLEIPASIGRLTALEVFSCSHNQLTRLPDTLGCCVLLRRFWCYENHLTRLPESLSCCTRLIQLWSDKHVKLPKLSPKCVVCQ